METKIPMKTIYLILVITIGLVGLGIGSTLAVFTASAEISNPISFSSNLSYNGDIFDTVEVTIGPNATRTTNVSIFNDEQMMALSMLCGIFMKEIVMIYLLSEIKKVI